MVSEKAQREHCIEHENTFQLKKFNAKEKAMSAIKNHYFDWINSEAYALQNLEGNDCGPHEQQHSTPALSKQSDDSETEPLPF
jgi:hypothetical protein